MSVQVTPHPSWVADLDATLDPSREAILDTRVIVHASENQLIDWKIQNFLVAFYPIIRDFPQWLQLLLDRSPDDGKAFFRDNIRVEKRHDATPVATGANTLGGGVGGAAFTPRAGFGGGRARGLAR